MRARLPIGLAFLVTSAVILAAAPPGTARVSGCELTGTVDSGSAAFLSDCVQRAEAMGSDALLVRVDTPGGALEATREVVASFLGARVPVLVWVGPSGAHAASAGMFIALSAHVAAMAPGTNIGAASPVVGPTGQDPEAAGGETMGKKVMNDTAAFAEAIARQRGRNVEWAVEAVREAKSASAEAAVELGAVDLLADSPQALLEQVHGTERVIDGEPTALRTAGAEITWLRPSLSQQLVHALSNPGLAYVLFLVGTLGLALELSSPGLIVPGVMGAVSLVLALIAFSALPIHAGAIVLMLIGAGLLVAELFVASGLLAAGGTALLLLSGVLLIDRFDPEWFIGPSFRVPLRLVIPTALLAGAASAFVFVRVRRGQHLPAMTGDLGLIGEVGHVLEQVGEQGGSVFVHGERWDALSPRPIAPGATVTVRGVRGLTLFVEEVGP